MKSVIIIAIAFVFLFVPLNAYATDVDDIDYSDDPEYEGMTPLRVYTIFASQTFFGCDEYDQDKLDFFNRITKEVLKQYDFRPIRGNSHECVIVSGSVDFDRNNTNPENYGLTLDATLEKAKDWHPNLTIIIFDNELSRQYFEQTRFLKDGEYYIWLGHIEKRVEGESDIIVSTSDLNEIEEPLGAWVLSHELAHFALRYYENPRNIWVDYVHNTDDDYEDCQKIQFSEGYCSETYSTVKVFTGNLKILKPYEKPVYSEPVYSEPVYSEPVYSEPTCPTGTVLKNGICVTISTTENNSFMIQKIQESKSNIQSLHKKITTMNIIDINTMVLKNPDFQNSLNSLKNEKNVINSRIDFTYDDVKVANNWYEKGQYSESLNFFKSIENNLRNISTDFYSYDKKLRLLINKDLTLYQERLPPIIQKSSTTTLELENNDKTIGETLWLEENYPANTLGVVRIIDPDMDFNSEVKDSFNVDVWSDSDKQGIELTVTETYKSTGIFEGKVFFPINGESSGDKLRVAVSDTVTVKYEDKTLPYPYTTTDELDITATTHMTEPFCDEGTILKDGICIVEKEKEVGWFDWFWNWFQ